MRGEDVLDDGQAESGSALIARSALVDPIEAFGEARQMLLRDANAVVRDAERDLVGGMGLGLEGDGPARVGVFDGVVDEVDEHASDAVRVAVGRGDLVGHVGVKRDVLFVGFELQRVLDFLEEGGEVELFLRHFHLPGLDFGDGREVAGQVFEPGDVVEDLLQKSPIHLLVVEGAVEEGFGKALRREDGRLEFVGDVSDKLAPVAFPLLELLNFVVEPLAGAVHLPEQQVEFVVLKGGGGGDGVEVVLADRAEGVAHLTQRAVEPVVAGGIGHPAQDEAQQPGLDKGEWEEQAPRKDRDEGHRARDLQGETIEERRQPAAARRRRTTHGRHSAGIREEGTELVRGASGAAFLTGAGGRL